MRRCSRCCPKEGVLKRKVVCSDQVKERKGKERKEGRKKGKVRGSRGEIIQTSRTS